VDQRQLTGGNGFQPALQSRADFAGLFDFFAVAVKCAGNCRVVRTRIDRDTDEILVLYGKAVREEARYAGLLRMIAVVVVARS
jgi:hypothetical protein